MGNGGFERAAEKYEDLEEQGKLRIFPCAIGDTVYRINKGAKQPIIPLQVLNFKIFNNNLVESFKMECADEWDGGYSYRKTDIGRDVFLTKQAAEHALKEMEGRTKMCSGECCVCACGGWCLAGHGDDDFIPASKERIVENLNNNRYERYREYMIKYLKEKYNFDYIKNQESEGKSMLHNVTVKQEENKVLEWVWVMIAMRNSKLAEYDPKTKITKDLGEESRVMAKKELDHGPTLDEIAQFLYDSKADFVSVVQKYRFDGELPFC